MKIGPDATCARCGRPADGYATINGERYCHGDDPEPSCYMRQSWANSTTGGVDDEVRLAHIVAQAIRVADGQHTMGAGALGEVAVAAMLAALPPSDGQLRNALRALIEEWRYKGEFGWGPWQLGEGPDLEGWVRDQCAERLRDLLDPTDRPAGDA